MRTLVNNFNRLRQVNSGLVREMLLQGEGFSKAELARQTGLSIATCGNIVAEMVASGEVMKQELGRPEGGRPPRIYRYNPQYSLAALIFPRTDDGRKFITWAVIDALGNTMAGEQRNVAMADCDCLAGLLRELIDRFGNIKAVAVSIPGLVKNGRIGFCDFPELIGTEVLAALTAVADLPIVFDNDMNVAALGYYRHECGSESDSVLYLMVPRKNCSGAGMVVEGKVIRGHTAFAGELSFMPLGMTRKRMFDGLSPEEALAYTGQLAAMVIPVFNPSVLVVASELMGETAVEALRETCLRTIPAEHMPFVATRESMDQDCLDGLALMAVGLLRQQVRLVEEDKVVALP